MSEVSQPREVSHEERVGHILQAVYARKTRKKQTFMADLKEVREQKFKETYSRITNSVGPRWYQALSEVQREALANLKGFIHADILEAHPHRVAGVLNVLGIFPQPNATDLLCCIYAGRHDPKMMLAQLYLVSFGYPIEAKQQSYCLNARLLLSAILYLGLDGLITLLRERFKPDADNTAPPPKPKSKPATTLESPYLEKLVAYLYEKPKYQRPPPPPLPNLDDLNEPYEPLRVAPKPPPPPPPPPPPKKRLPKSYCDKLAGIQPIGFYTESNINLIMGQSSSQIPDNTKRDSSPKRAKEKKRYGVNLPPRKHKHRKLKCPTTGMNNAQYMINGVYVRNGKPYIILGNVTMLPPQGHLIHGGSAYVKGAIINIHCGFRGFEPPPLPIRCDCTKKWHDTAFRYLKDTKCHCGHHFDYKNEGNFSKDDLPYFLQATRHSPAQFNYHYIYDLDKAHYEIEKQFTNIWKTDSMLAVGKGKSQDDDKKKKRKKYTGSQTCLGNQPRPSDYLKCALRYMIDQNLAARLPDLHLVPELKEWMRCRLYGPLSAAAKLEYNRRSSWYWAMFDSLANKNFGHVSPPQNPLFSRHVTDWAQKHSLTKKFKVYVQQYKIAMFRSFAEINNIFWRTMYQAEFPDKKFREIYFSYMFSSVNDVTLFCPYNSKQAHDRMLTMAKKRCICLPPEVEKMKTM